MCPNGEQGDGVQFPQHAKELSTEHLKTLGPYVRVYCITSRNSIPANSCKNFAILKQEVQLGPKSRCYTMPFMVFFGRTMARKEYW